MITIKCTKNFRNFQEGEVFSFSKPTILFGSNGSGKTTLLQAIRVNLKVLSLAHNVYGDPDKTIEMLSSREKKVQEFFKVESSFEEALSLFRVEDTHSHNPMMDAWDWVSSGGWQASRMSHGEESLFLISKYLGSRDKMPLLRDSLILFDEVDTGLDWKTLFLFGNRLVPALLNLNCHLLLATHSYLTIKYLQSYMKIFFMDERRYICYQEYQDLITKE